MIIFGWAPFALFLKKQAEEIGDDSLLGMGE
jgi:hypothetical protein